MTQLNPLKSVFPMSKSELLVWSGVCMLIWAEQIRDCYKESRLKNSLCGGNEIRLDKKRRKEQRNDQSKQRKFTEKKVFLGDFSREGKKGYFNSFKQKSFDFMIQSI